MKVAVVGGGLAGLTVAEALLSADPSRPLDVSVYEQHPRAGGLVRSERVDGFLCEHGPSGFLDNVAATSALIDRLGLGGRLIASRDEAKRRYIFRAGRLRALPAAPPGLLTSGVLPLTGAVRALAEPFIPARRAAGDESIRAFAARRFGHHAADVLADAMVSGVFAGDAGALSLEACFPDLPRMEREHGSVVRGLLARGRRAPARLVSLVDGLEELVAALAARLGARLHLATAVVSVERAGASYRVTLGSGRVETVEAIVLACEVPAVTRILGPLVTAASDFAVPTAPIGVVCVGYPAATLPRALDGFGFLAPRSAGIRSLGAVWESGIFAGRAPEGHVLLRVMVGGATDPDAIRLDDATLLAEVRRDLRIAMGLEAPPVFTRVVRHRPGLPQYVLGHPVRLQRFTQALDAHPGLYVGGHGLRGVGVNALVEDAARLAALVRARLPAPSPA
jgi:oxygen-dependent protoporphyrinogen oxidase